MTSFNISKMQWTPYWKTAKFSCLALLPPPKWSGFQPFVCNVFPSKSTHLLYKAIIMKRPSPTDQIQILPFPISPLCTFPHSPSAEVVIWFKCDSNAIVPKEASMTKHPPSSERISLPFLHPLHMLILPSCAPKLFCFTPRFLSTYLSVDDELF